MVWCALIWYYRLLSCSLLLGFALGGDIGPVSLGYIGIGLPNDCLHGAMLYLWGTVWCTLSVWLLVRVIITWLFMLITLGLGLDGLMVLGLLGLWL